MNFSFNNSQFTIIYQLSSITVATWKMVNGKLMTNDKWLMVSTTSIGDAQ